MDAKEPVSTKDVDFRITVIEEAVRLGRAGEPAHMAKICAKYELSIPTLYRWMNAVEGLPRQGWAAALQVRYKGRQKFADITPDAWEFFVKMYRETASAEMAHKYCIDRAKQKGWAVPSARTLQRKLVREGLMFPRGRFVKFDL